jgi:hypothetical protein
MIINITVQVEIKDDNGYDESDIGMAFVADNEKFSDMVKKFVEEENDVKVDKVEVYY